MLTRIVLGNVLANVVSTWAVPAIAWQVAILSDLQSHRLPRRQLLLRDSKRKAWD